MKVGSDISEYTRLQQTTAVPCASEFGIVPPIFPTFSSSLSRKPAIISRAITRRRYRRSLGGDTNNPVGGECQPQQVKRQVSQSRKLNNNCSAKHQFGITNTFHWWTKSESLSVSETIWSQNLNIRFGPELTLPPTGLFVSPLMELSGKCFWVSFRWFYVLFYRLCVNEHTNEESGDDKQRRWTRRAQNNSTDRESSTIECISKIKLHNYQIIVTWTNTFF